MKAFTLTQAAEGCGGILKNPTEGIITQVTIDSRQVEPGSLYIAIMGERFDGHDFIEDCYQKGAACVVSHKELDTQKPYILVKDTRLALGNLGSWYRQWLNPFVVGVTGSVGKTSTKEMVWTVLSAGETTGKTQGNLNNDIGLPRTLLSLEEEQTAAVVEMGMNHKGEISYLTNLAKPNAAIITNIGTSHIENLGSRENILAAKLEILEGLAKDGPVILNADNDLLATLKQIDLHHPKLYYGIQDTTGALYAKQVQVTQEQTRFVLVYQGKEYPAMVPAVGKHHVYNAMASFLAGRLRGLEPEAMVEAMSHYENTGMRQKMIRHPDGYTIIADCYNASPDSMESSIAALSAMECSGKRIAALGDMLELGEQSYQLHCKVGAMVADSLIDILLCFGPESKYICEGAYRAGFDNIIWCKSKEKMAATIAKNCRPGDVVLFKASRGMHFEEVIDAICTPVTPQEKGEL